MSRLYKVVLEGQNEESAKQLRGMRLLSALRHTDQWGTVLGDRPSYTQWLSTKGFPADSDIYGLASLAWELGEFELAHHLAELEDMADAHV
jgi:hypothetical protein